MSDTKIVIDKEQIESLIKQYETSDNPFYRGKLSQLKGILAHATEIQIDKSIEDAAKKYSETNCYGLEEYDEGGYLGINERELARLLVDFSTQQQIIEQLKLKELRKWIIDNSNEINIIDIINKIAELTNEKN